MEKKQHAATIFQGSIFDVTKDEIIIENGSRAIREIVHHAGGVGVLAIQDHKVLLVKQYRYAMQCELLEIPAGKREPEEDPATCGLRELEEETGYRGDLKLFAVIASTPGFCTEKIYLYEASHLQKVVHPKSMDEDEDITIHWMDLEEAYHMIQNGSIYDAKTVIAIQHAYIKSITGTGE